jgi:hypothetical protein
VNGNLGMGARIGDQDACDYDIRRGSGASTKWDFPHATAEDVPVESGAI